jgi:hypothetical protein
MALDMHYWVAGMFFAQNMIFMVLRLTAKVKADCLLETSYLLTSGATTVE